MNDIRQSFAQHGLVRSRDQRVLGGVLAGLGRRFGLTPWVARLVFVLLLLVVPGSQLLVYPILWILMPSDDSRRRPGPARRRRPHGVSAPAGPRPTCEER